MSSLLPFVVSGVVTGSVYGLAASGLTLSYKTSGIFNFAYGAIATTAAYLYYWLTVIHLWDWKPAVAVSVLGVGVGFGLVFEVAARQVAKKPVVLRIVATVGIILVVQSLATLKFGPDPVRVEQFLPGGSDTLRLGGVNITWAQVATAAISLVCVAGLYAFLRFARSGLAMRAVVDDPHLVGLHGTSPAAVRRIAWVIGSTLSALSGVLLAPMVGVHAITLTYLVLAAAGAAAIGGFSSIPLSLLGGFVIGVAADVSQKFVLTNPDLAGLPLSMPFIILLVALLLTRRRKLISSAVVEKRPASGIRAPWTVQLGGGAVVLVLLLLVPQMVGTDLVYYTQSLSLLIMLLSLGMLIRTSGQISLCHAAFAGIGAVAFAQLVGDLHLPWGVSLLLAGLIVVPVAALVAIPAIRLTGLFLALATLAFGVVVERLFYPLGIGFTTQGSGRAMPRPSFAQTEFRYYYVVLGIVVVCAALMVLLDRARLGRMLRGVSDSPTAVATMGLGMNSIKVLVFCISGFFAAISGVLHGATVHYATYADPAYISFHSLVLVAILVIAPLQTPWYALIAIPATVIPAYIDSSNATYWLSFLFGVFAIVVAMQGGTPPMPHRVAALMQRLGRSKRHHQIGTVDLAPTPVHAAEVAMRATEDGLAITGVSVRFGGLIAVSDVSLEAPIGRITGLIGPNGAGKTTTFNACSGLNKPSSGQVFLKGQDVTAMGAAARARNGLGRTFQVTELCETLTVAENVALGREAGLAGSNALRQIFAGRSRREVSEAARAAMMLCGIADLADVPATQLSTGERRLVEVARCLAGKFDVLLLDEPSAGLDRTESARLGDVLTRVIEERRCGILLVEHDMALVMRVCDHIYVLDSGQLLFEGSAEAVAASPLVRAAYLGAEAVDAPEPPSMEEEEVAMR